MRNNYANYTQTLHLTLHLSDFPRVTKCIVYALNYTQTIHKLYIETFQTLHKNYTRKPTTQHESYTKTIHESLHRNYTFCFLNTNQTNQTDEANEACVTKVTCVTCVTKGRAKRKDGRNERTGETKGRVGDGLVTVSTGRHRGVTGAEFHHFI